MSLVDEWQEERPDLRYSEYLKLRIEKSERMFERRRWGSNRDPRLISPSVCAVGVALILFFVVAVHGVVG